jgi:signal transduction histidine kinase/DNA-binding response OmpR family regulator
MVNVRTLLITDDCAEDRDIYREYLLDDPQQSYQILEAASAEVGLALCQEKQCDAILLDFNLPDMSGLEFLDELKQRAMRLPVIMLTGQGDERLAVQALKHGAQDYLSKQHLQPDLLQLTVRNVIQQSCGDQPTQTQPAIQSLTATIALRIRQSLNLEQILQTAVTEVQQLLECDRVTIYQVDPAQSRLDQICQAGSEPQTADPLAKFMAFLSAQSQVEHTQGERNGKTEPAEPSQQGATTFLHRAKKSVQSYLLVPLPHRSAQVESDHQWGLLVACQSDQRQWQVDEARFLTELSGQLAIAIQQAEQLTEAVAALETAKQINSRQSHFVGAVAAAYRTPLTVILTAASTLKTHAVDLPEAKRQQFLQMIEDKAKQMAQLIDDLLVIEQLKFAKTTFAPVPFELLQYVADIVEEQRHSIANRHQLTLKIAGNTRGFWGNQKLLRQILVNLLSNAVKYSPEASPIEVELTGDASSITITVKDAGIGIPASEQDQLFASFSRGSNVGLIPGTGLGLAIVKECVDLHGGDITLASQEDLGTEVTVRLPKR